METIADSKRRSDKTTMQRFGDSGMMLLPWTKQILSVLWEHLRLLLHVICYSLLSVFQMFRFEVHLRITDETGNHVEHMTTTSSNRRDRFFLNSLFANNKNVIVGGPNPLSKLNGDSFGVSPHSRSLLSSLVSDELCCSIVDDFVSCATDCLSEDEDIYIGPHCSWKSGYDWNVFVGSEKNSCPSDDACSSDITSKFSTNFDITGESIGHSVFFEGPECKKFDNNGCETWECLWNSKDSLNYSACKATPSQKKATQKETPSCENDLVTLASKDIQVTLHRDLLDLRSDSESSWGSSDNSCAEGDREENDKLWELLSTSADPYHPLHFTAAALSTASNPGKRERSSKPGLVTPQTSVSPSVSPTCSDLEKSETTGPLSSEDDEEDEEALWRSLSQSDDPYHPLNFRACLKSSVAGGTQGLTGRGSVASKPSEIRVDSSVTSARCKPCLRPRRVFKHRCHRGPEEKPSLVPWRKRTAPAATASHKKGTSCFPRKVRFSPQAQVHKMLAWSFAMQSSRKGPWEEIARDRARFQRRVQETEQAIGYCLSQSHRETLLAYQESAWCF